MTDQTPEEILNDWVTTVIAGDGERSIRSKTGQEHVAALAAAGYRIVPIVDDATRQEVEALCASLLDAGSDERICNAVDRARELLSAAYLGRTDK